MTYEAADGVHLLQVVMSRRNLFSVHPTERFVLNGKVKVMLTKVC